MAGQRLYAMRYMTNMIGLTQLVVNDIRTGRSLRYRCDDDAQDVGLSSLRVCIIQSGTMHFVH